MFVAKIFSLSFCSFCPSFRKWNHVHVHCALCTMTMFYAVVYAFCVTFCFRRIFSFCFISHTRSCNVCWFVSSIIELFVAFRHVFFCYLICRLVYMCHVSIIMRAQFTIKQTKTPANEMKWKYKKQQTTERQMKNKYARRWVH